MLIVRSGQTVKVTGLQFLKRSADSLLNSVMPHHPPSKVFMEHHHILEVRIVLTHPTLTLSRGHMAV